MKQTKRPKKSRQPKNAATELKRATDNLAAWERKAKTAATKIKKYKRRIRFYSADAVANRERVQLRRRVKAMLDRTAHYGDGGMTGEGM